jgi:hypothetical protein
VLFRRSSRMTSQAGFALYDYAAQSTDNATACCKTFFTAALSRADSRICEEDVLSKPVFLKSDGLQEKISRKQFPSSSLKAEGAEVIFRMC